MVNKILVTYLILDLILAICGGGLLAVSVVSRSNLLQHVANGTIAIDNVARLLLVSRYPLNRTPPAPIVRPLCLFLCRLTDSNDACNT